VTWDIAVAGTVHRDDITTPAGRSEDQLGGSAVYFALAACRAATVHLNGIVGKDAADRFVHVLQCNNVRIDGLEISDRPTLRWHARHDFERWIAVDTSSDEGCDSSWRPRLGEAARDAQILFAASMRPSLQSEVMAQSSARLTGTDSMTDYTGPETDAVLAVARASDIVFLNRIELADLTGRKPDEWQDAARSLCGQGRIRAVVVKAGPGGAACVTTRRILEGAAVPVERVVDPTGAGDALAGGFLGACAAAERDDEDFFATALQSGLHCAAAAISAFGLTGLLQAK
jgi:sugar/nucleoside kinase (ribokinase family)